MKISVEFEDLIKKALDEASQNSTLIELISATSFKVSGFVFEIRFKDKIVSLHQQKSRKEYMLFVTTLITTGLMRWKQRIV